MTGNDLIERYIHEVGSHLPRRGREDIQRELLSLLQDAVEERTDDAEPSVQTVNKVLLEFGKPEVMAAQYRGEQYLIGPKLYPLFRTVSGIVTAVMLGLFLALLVLQLWTGNSADLASTIWNWFTDFLRTLFIAWGFMTIAFVLVEQYFGEEIDVEQPAAAWDPLTLPPVNDPNRINRFEKTLEIVLSVIFISLFIWAIAPDGVFGWLVADSFRPNIGWLIASSCIDILVKVAVLWNGRWNAPTRWFEISADIFGVYVLSRIVTSPVIATIAGLTIGIKFVFGIVLAILAVSIPFKIGKLLWNWQFGQRWQRSFSIKENLA